MNFKSFLYIFLILFSLSNAQTFDIEQTAQLIRPRLKLDSRYTFDAGFKDTNGLFNNFENTVGITFPIKTRYKVGLQIDLKNFKLKNILKNSINLQADQILGTFKVTSRNTRIGFDSIPQRNTYYANAGIIGLHLTKKYRLQFYSANITVHEEDKTLSELIPRASLLIGQYHIKGFKRCFYYGVSVIYSDKLLIPAPFIGGTEPLGEHFTFNYALPVQVNLQYRNKNDIIISGIKADGYRTGIKFLNKRTNINYSNVSAFINFRHRFSKNFQIQTEGGYYLYQSLNFDRNTAVKPTKYPVKGSFYANFSINVFFGKGLIEKIIEQLF